MKKEIPFQDGKVVLFKESNFWNELLERCKKGTKQIHIVTYNFNFRDKYERTFYRELSNLANSGVDVNLLYAIMTFSEEDKLEIEEIFTNFVLCAELKSNHSKLFITDDFAYVGSANFSFSSDKNYECGVVFENKEIIEQIKKDILFELLDKSEFTNVPEVFDPFDFLPRATTAVEKLVQVESIEELISSEVKHYIPELRFLEDLEKNLEVLGYPILVDFNWWRFYENIYEGIPVSNEEFLAFKKYINELCLYLTDVTIFINVQYQTIGRNELMKKAKVIE